MLYIAYLEIPWLYLSHSKNKCKSVKYSKQTHGTLISRNKYFILLSKCFFFIYIKCDVNISLFTFILINYSLVIHEGIALKLIIPLFTFIFISYNAFESRILKDITKKYENKFNNETKNKTFFVKTNNG